jgi:hypothetical protein
VRFFLALDRDAGAGSLAIGARVGDGERALRVVGIARRPEVPRPETGTGSVQGVAR